MQVTQGNQSCPNWAKDAWFLKFASLALHWSCKANVLTLEEISPCSWTVLLSVQPSWTTKMPFFFLSFCSVVWYYSIPLGSAFQTLRTEFEKAGSDVDEHSLI